LPFGDTLSVNLGNDPSSNRAFSAVKVMVSPALGPALVGKTGRLTRMNHDETEAVNEKQTKGL
jgi:hypothetical protein